MATNTEILRAINELKTTAKDNAAYISTLRVDVASTKVAIDDMRQDIKGLCTHTHPEYREAIDNMKAETARGDWLHTALAAIMAATADFVALSVAFLFSCL